MPKEDRKVQNVIIENKEMREELAVLKRENVAIRSQLEEILERGQKYARERKSVASASIDEAGAVATQPNDPKLDFMS